MAESVYVLINASIPGQLKIGRTTRDVEERARELSAHTGVPTPFVVAFTCEVKNSSFIESEIHKRLQLMGYRTSNNREFFAVPLKNAIEIIQEIVGENPFVCEDYLSRETGNAAEEAEEGVLQALRAVDQFFVVFKSEKFLSFAEASEACSLVHEVSKKVSEMSSLRVSKEAKEFLSRHSLNDFCGLYEELFDNSLEIAQSVYKNFESCALYAHEV